MALSFVRTMAFSNWLVWCRGASDVAELTFRAYMLRFHRSSDGLTKLSVLIIRNVVAKPIKRLIPSSPSHISFVFKEGKSHKNFRRYVSKMAVK